MKKLILATVAMIGLNILVNHPPAHAHEKPAPAHQGENYMEGGGG